MHNNNIRFSSRCFTVVRFEFSSCFFVDWLTIQSVHTSLLSFTMFMFLSMLCCFSFQRFTDWLIFQSIHIHLLQLLSLIRLRINASTHLLSLISHSYKNVHSFASVAFVDPFTHKCVHSLFAFVDLAYV
ncbi:hypothetical protein BDR07DRAFT_46170 [Suillus spraguei]|nr:hypothetical protein BDR07DRAFT_46170 [Suillus spraguei]